MPNPCSDSIPALLDAHLHFWEYALFQTFPVIDQAVSWEQAVETVRAQSSGEWLIGVRLDPECLQEKRMPDRGYLDRVFGQRPCILVRCCLHLAVINTAAMRILGFQAEAGVLLEAEVFSALNRLVRCLGLAPAEVAARAARNLRQQGIARWIDMAMDRTKREWLPAMDYYTTDWELLDEALGFKIFLDGGLGARTAALSVSYRDDPGNRGRLNHSDQELLVLVQRVRRRNKPVAVHAIGDRAVDQFLRVSAKVDRHPWDRLEHVQYARQDQLERLAELGVAICIQPIFSLELSWAEQRLGAERMATAYAWRLMQRLGIRLLAGSDAPVADSRPQAGAAAAAAASGNSWLAAEAVLELYRQNNWKFYNFQQISE